MMLNGCSQVAKKKLKTDRTSFLFDNLDELKTVMQSTPGDYPENLYRDGEAAAKITAIIKKHFN